jgi:hypothetical protein
LDFTIDLNITINAVKINFYSKHKHMKPNPFFVLLLTIIISNSMLAQTTSQQTLLCNAGWIKTEWKVTPAFAYWPNRGAESNLMNGEKECTKDDYYVFNIDGSYQLLNNVKKCVEGEEDLVSSGTWAFMKNDNTILNMVKGGKGGILQKKIVALSQYRFSFTTTQVRNGITYLFTETYTPIQ